MRGDAIGAEISRGANEKDVFLLLSRKGALLDENCVREIDLCLDQIRSHRLRAEEVRDKPERIFDLGERRIIGLVQRFFANVTHRVLISRTLVQLFPRTWLSRIRFMISFAIGFKKGSGKSNDPLSVTIRIVFREESTTTWHVAQCARCCSS